MRQEKKRNKKKKIPLLSAALILCLAMSGCARAASVPMNALPAEQTGTAESFSVEDIRAGDDFYGWCNAKELMSMEIPASKQSSGTFDKVQETADKQIEEIILALAESGEDYVPGSNEQLIRDLYKLAYDSCTGAADNVSRDEETARRVFADIESVESIPGLFALWERLGAEYGVYPAVCPAVMPDLYEPSENRLTLCQMMPSGDIKSAVESEWAATSIREQYKRYLVSIGVGSAEARERATQMTYLLLDIGTMTKFAKEDEPYDPSEYYFPYTAGELSGKLANIGTDDICRIAGIADTDRFVLQNDRQLFMIDSLLDEAHLPVWKDYTLCAFIEQYVMALPESCGGNPRRLIPDPVKAAVNEVSMTLYKEIGELYAEKYLSVETCRDVEALCGEIKDEYEVLINGSGTLSDEGKAALVSKLKNMPCFVGAGKPHEVKPEDADKIGSTLLETEIRGQVKAYREQLEKLGRKNEPDGFDMIAPQTVNAVYDPQNNCFTVTAAILNAPFYDKNAEHAVNLGSIGTVIGHEISHAFDSSGMNYDAEGRYRPEWIPAADREAFKKIQQRTVEYYNGFTVLDNYHVKGKATLCENLADISAMQCALAIAKTPEEQKKVFESYAEVWKMLSVDNIAQDQLTFDVHSPAPVRVNAVAACFDEFYSIYGVQEGDKLYVAPDERIRRW